MMRIIAIVVALGVIGGQVAPLGEVLAERLIFPKRNVNLGPDGRRATRITVASPSAPTRC